MFKTVALVVCLSLYIEDVNGIVINVPGSVAGVDSEYILYTAAKSWNTARRVCQSIGGRLARIDTVELLLKIQNEAAITWQPHWDHLWTGLHRAPDQSLVFDDDECSPFNVEISTMNVFKDAHDYEYDAGRRCLRVQEREYRLEKHNCSAPLNFLCERKRDNCQYKKVDTSAKVVSQTNATAVSCQNACNLLSGCYLAGNYYNSHCVLLTAAVTSHVFYEKACFSASRNSSNTDVYKNFDDGLPIPNTCPVTSVIVTELPSTSSAHAPDLDLCPVSVSHLYTSSSLLECSSEIITLPPSMIDVTVTETLTETAMITETEVLSDCDQSQTSAADLTASLYSSSVISTHAPMTTITSTIMTTILDCPTTEPAILTVTHSCPQTSFQTTTETTHEEISCLSASPSGPSGSAGPTTENNHQTTICTSYNFTEIDIGDLDKIVESLVHKLTVAKENLSKTIRKKISVPDPRVSSQGIGFTAIIIAILPFVIAIMVDIPTILRDFRQSFLSVKYNSTP